MTSVNLAKEIHSSRHATGGPDAITPASIGAATSESVTAAVAALVNAAPGTLDTLGEVAAALAADESAAAALVTTVAGKTTPADVDTKIASNNTTERALQNYTFALIDPDRVSAGESNMPRWSAQSAAVVGSSGYVRWATFTATKTETITKLAVVSGTGAAGATPTLVRIGVWTCAPDGALIALVAATANDTSIFSAINTIYERATLAPFNKVAGQRYAAGILVVTAATAPQYVGLNAPGMFFVGNALPRLTGMSAAGQTDLPASSTNPGANALAPYVEMRP